MQFLNFLLSQFFIISIICSEEICNLNSNCSNCTACYNYSECNFYNIFCKKSYNSYDLLQNVRSNLSLYYKKDPDINSFCNSRTIYLNSIKKSFTIFESNSQTLSGKLNKIFNCEFSILNKYYLNHDTDQAKLFIEIQQKYKDLSENMKLKFDIIFLFTQKEEDTIRFDEVSDDILRGKSYNRFLDGFSEIEILINFRNKDSDNIEEILIINIETLNPSEKLRLIYIIIISILCLFLFVVVALIVTYFFLKRRMMRERERMIYEEEEKKEMKKKLIQNFLMEELKPQLFNEKINLNDNDMCTICCEKFVLGVSEVSVTPCSHVFHHECIEKWIKEKITDPLCPNCKFSFLKYMENPTKIQIEKSENLKININDNEKEKNNNNNSNENKKNEEENIPSSDQMRINTIFMNNENNIDNNNIEGSVHISDEGNNNN